MDTTTFRGVDDIPAEFPEFNDICDFLFVYEFGSTMHQTAMKPAERWKVIDMVYGVFQSEAQIGAASKLDSLHYQLPVKSFFSEAKSFFASGGGLCQITFVGNNGVDDSNIFIAAAPSSINASSVGHTLFSLVKDFSEKNNGPKSGEKVSRQRLYKDFGFCNDSNSSHYLGCQLGIARPRVFNNTDKIPDKVFDLTNEVMNLTQHSKVMAKFSIPEKRQHLFARQLHEKNIVEAMRVNTTLKKSLPSGHVHHDKQVFAHNTGNGADFICFPHCDTYNSKNIPMVPWLSVLHKDEESHVLMRHSMVMYWKRSIDCYFDRVNVHGHYLKVVQKVFAEISNSRKSFSLDTISDSTEIHIGQGFVFGKDFSVKSVHNCLTDYYPEHKFALAKVKCNMRTECYYQVFVANIYWLIVGFNLSLTQGLSVWISCISCLESGAYFGLASAILLANKKYYKKKGDIGYQLYKWVVVLCNEIKNPPFRFAKYNRACIHWSEDAWMKMVNRIRSKILILRKREKFSQIEYNKFHYDLISNLRNSNTGQMKVNHLIGIGAIAGFAPLAFFHFVKGDPKKAFNQIRSYCEGTTNDINQSFPTDKKLVLRNARFAIDALVGIKHSDRTAENILCKIGRMLANSDSRFYDLIDRHFPLIDVQKKKIIFSAKNFSVELSSLFTIDDRNVLKPNSFEMGPRKKNLSLVHFM